MSKKSKEDPPPQAGEAKASDLTEGDKVYNIDIVTTSTQAGAARDRDAKQADATYNIDMVEESNFDKRIQTL